MRGDACDERERERERGNMRDEREYRRELGGESSEDIAERMDARRERRYQSADGEGWERSEER